MRMFSVKNFDKFQHYKDRSPPWIKLYNELLDDYEFGSLPDASKMHLIAIWLLASRSENKIPFDPRWVGRRINANEQVNLSLLADRGFILLDQELHTSEQDASTTLADCLSRGREEVEVEVETKKEKKESREIALFDDWPNDCREQFWSKYPHKVGKSDALAKLDRARKQGVSFACIMDGVGRYIRDKPPDRPWCNPATWLNQARWDDQPAPVNGSHVSTPFQNRTDQASGRATDREALHLAAMGRGAARRLEERTAAGRDGEVSDGVGVTDVFDLRARSEIAH